MKKKKVKAILKSRYAEHKVKIGRYNYFDLPISASNMCNKADAIRQVYFDLFSIDIETEL